MTKFIHHQMLLFYKPSISYYKDYLILLNYNENDSKINLKNFDIIEKNKNCFYLKKND